jgi:hypothetical protein
MGVSPTKESLIVKNTNSIVCIGGDPGKRLLDFKLHDELYSRRKAAIMSIYC